MPRFEPTDEYRKGNQPRRALVAARPRRQGDRVKMCLLQRSSPPVAKVDEG